MFDVTAIGELLIDFTECGVSENGMRLFEQNPGGAVANVAAAVSKLGGSAAFLGKIGKDMHRGVPARHAGTGRCKYGRPGEH